MYQVPGPITRRLLSQFGERSDGWAPDRTAKPTPSTAAACGWPLCGRQITPAGPSAPPAGTPIPDRPGSPVAA